MSDPHLKNIMLPFWRAGGEGQTLVGATWFRYLGKWYWSGKKVWWESREGSNRFPGRRTQLFLGVFPTLGGRETNQTFFFFAKLSHKRGSLFFVAR